MENCSTATGLSRSAPVLTSEEWPEEERNPAVDGVHRNGAEISEAYRAVARVVHHVSVWFRTYGKILTKDQRLVTPLANEYQREIMAAYEWCMQQGIPCRILGLKPRQKGSSTVSAAIMYHHARRFRCRGVQIADRHRNSDNLFTMTNRYAEHDQFYWGSEWEATSTAATCTRSGELWSRIDKDTAENPRAGRSGTIQALHVSEAAHFPNDGEKSADKTMLSLLNSLADVPESVAIVETTANGAAGWFYEQWLGAATFEEFQAGNRGNGWIRIFSPWFVFDDSGIPVSEAEQLTIRQSLTSRELRGVEVHGWDIRQVAWRRRTIAQKCAGREVSFDQEYPEDPITAFSTSGRPRFSVLGLSRLRKMSGIRVSTAGLLHRDGGMSVEWEPNESGWCQIWEPPKEQGRYLLWCDTATGREQTRDSRNPDRHSVLVLRAPYCGEDGETWDAALVARIRPPCFDDWHVLEEKVIALSLYYGRCLIGVEVPMGLTLLEGLRRAGMPLFRRRAANGEVEKLGFQSNAATKPLVIASLSRAIDGDPALEIWDSHAVDELASFVVHQDGSEAALPGRHDDDVMALAMAVHHLKLATPFPKIAAQKSKGPPSDLRRWRKVC